MQSPEKDIDGRLVAHGTTELVQRFIAGLAHNSLCATIPSDESLGYCQISLREGLAGRSAEGQLDLCAVCETASVNTLCEFGLLCFLSLNPST